MRTENLQLRLIEQDESTVWLEIATPSWTVEVIANIRLDKEEVVPYGLHIDGPGAGRIGPSGLRLIADQVMELYDVEALVIRGFRRTTGSTPGRIPDAMRFPRRRYSAKGLADGTE